MSNNSVTLKELRDKFYQLRDLEISNLWTRTSILAGLIGLFFAGYGYVVLDKDVNELTLHILCCGIAVLAIIFSMIWIAMTKSSKAWVEVHERNICEIEAEKELGIPTRFRMGAINYTGLDSEPDTCLLSSKPGRFSPSKLNIFIGQALLICWSFILLIHMYLLVPQPPCKDTTTLFESILDKYEYMIYSLVALVVCIITIPILWRIIACRNKSGALLTKEKYLSKRLEKLLEEIETTLDDNIHVNVLLTEIKDLLENVQQSPMKMISQKDIESKMSICIDKILPTCCRIIWDKTKRDKNQQDREKLKREIAAFFREVIAVVKSEKENENIQEYVSPLIKDLKKHLPNDPSTP